MKNDNIRVERITPEIANRYLLRNKASNRSIKWWAVHDWAKDMKDGRWKVTPASMIIFDKNGELIDGQHRLHACIEAGVTFDTYVARDVDPDTFAVTDIGNVRSVADQIYMPQSKQVAALSRKAFATKNGVQNIEQSFNGVTENYRKKIKKDSHYSGKGHATKTESVDDINQNEDFYLNCIRDGARIQYLMGGAVSSYAYFVWLVRWLGQDDRLDSFITEYCDHTSTAGSIPALRFLLSQELRKKGVKQFWIVCALLLTYDSYRNKQSIKTFRKMEDTKKRYDSLIKEKRRKDEADNSERSV